MNDAGMQKKRCNESQTVESRCLRWNESEALDNIAKMRKGESTGANDGCGK
jgi:hypothetical protein